MGRRVGRDLREIPILVNRETGEDCIKFTHVTYKKEVKSKGKVTDLIDIDPRIAVMTIQRNFTDCVESEVNFLKTPAGDYQWEIPEPKRIRNLIPRGQSPGWMNIWTKMSKGSGGYFILVQKKAECQKLKILSFDSKT